MTARFKVAAFLRLHLAEFAELLRLMNLYRCTQSLRLHEEALERARNELAQALDDYNHALADCRLHADFAAQEEVRVVLPLKEGGLQ